MPFLASFVRTLTLAFAALHFLDPSPLGKLPTPPRVDPARRVASALMGLDAPGMGGRSPSASSKATCQKRSREREARKHLYEHAWARAGTRLASARDAARAQLALRRACWAAAPDLVPGLRCFLRAELALAPTTDEEKAAVREGRRAYKAANVTLESTFETPKSLREEIIMSLRNKENGRIMARAAQLTSLSGLPQLLPRADKATTEVWRHIRATPQGEPNGTDVRAWARKTWFWGPLWLGTFATDLARCQETISPNETISRWVPIKTISREWRLSEEKKAIAAAELTFHLFDGSLKPLVQANLTILTEALALPFEDYESARPGVIPLVGGKHRTFAGWALLRMLDRGGPARSAARDALKPYAKSIAASVADPQTRLVALHLLTHVSQDDATAEAMVQSFPAEKLCSALEGYLFSAHGECRRDVWLRRDEEKVWLLEAGYRAVWGLARDNARIAEHCARGLVGAITGPGRDFFRERERAVALSGTIEGALAGFDYEAATVRNAAFALRILARDDRALPHVARRLGLRATASVGDVDEAIMVASGADAAAGLESAFAFLGRSTVPPFLRRDAQRAVARTRVAWHHPAHAAPAVYSSLTVELLAAGLLRASWLRPFLGEEATAALAKRAAEQALFSSSEARKSPPDDPVIDCGENRFAISCNMCAKHQGVCGGDCHRVKKSAFAFFANALVEDKIKDDANKDTFRFLFDPEVTERWEALDDAGKKPFHDLAAADEGRCRPKSAIVDCGDQRVAEYCGACATDHGNCGGDCYRVTKPAVLYFAQVIGEEVYVAEEKVKAGYLDWTDWSLDDVPSEIAERWQALDDAGKKPFQDLAVADREGDAACQPIPIVKATPVPPKPERWAKAKHAFTVFYVVARENWVQLLVFAIGCGIIISQRTIIQHVCQKFSETFFELYIIALTDACARHFLLICVALIAWARVGAPWLPFIFAPVFYGTLLPLWFLLACWLLVCVVVPVWAAHTAHRFAMAAWDAIKRRRASKRAAQDGRTAVTNGATSGAAVEAVLTGALGAQGAPPGSIHIRVRDRGAAPSEVVYFKVGLNVRLGAVLEAFAERKSVPLDTLRFRVEGADVDVEDVVPTVQALGLANLVLIDCFARERPATEAAAPTAAVEPETATPIPAAEEATEAPAAPAPAAEEATEPAAEEATEPAAADAATQTPAQTPAAAALAAYLARAELGDLAAHFLEGRTVESLENVTKEELITLGFSAADAEKLLTAMQDRPPALNGALERVEAAVDQVAADLNAQGAAQWADLAADVAAEASDAIRGCASTLVFVIGVALLAPVLCMLTAVYVLLLEVILDGVDQVLCTYVRDVVTWQRGLGTLCNAAFVLTLAGPLLKAERRMVARVQVVAALKPFLRMCDSVKNRLTRRAVPRHAVEEGDVCPICHEELADEDMGPLGFCRWGCGRAVHAECAALWLTKSDSCVLCGAAWS